MREVGLLNRSQMLIKEHGRKKRINRTIQEDIVFVENHIECTIPAGSVIVGRAGDSLKILRPHDHAENDLKDQNRVIWLTTDVNATKIKYEHRSLGAELTFQSQAAFEQVNNLIWGNPDMDLQSLKEEVSLFDHAFIDGQEINSFRDKSNFSGTTPSDFNYVDELKIPKRSFCDGRFSYLSPKIDEVLQKPILFMNLLIPDNDGENNGYKTAYISIQPVGSPASSYDIFYCSADDVRQNPNQKISNFIKHYQISVEELGAEELDPKIIRGFSEYQISLEASIKAIGQTDITQKSAFISPEISNHNAPELKRAHKTSAFRKFLSNTSGVFMVLFIVAITLALGGTALSLSLLIAPTWLAFFAATLGISSLSTLTTILLPGIILFAPSLLLITSLWRRTKDSNQNIATNQTIGSNLQRLSIANGAITLLAAIVINTFFPELLIITAIVGITVSLTLFISSRVLQSNKGVLQSSLKADTDKKMPPKALGYLIIVGSVIASLTIAGATLAIIGMPFFATITLLLNPWFLFGAIIVAIVLFVSSRFLKNIEFDSRIEAIDDKMKTIECSIMPDEYTAEVISVADQKAELESYRQAIINRYSGTLLQNIFAVGVCLILPGLALLTLIPLSPSIAFLLGAVLALGVSINSAFVNSNSAQKSITSDENATKIATKMIQTKRWFNAGSRCLHAIMSVTILSIVAINIPMIAAYLAITATLTLSIVGIAVLVSLLIINIMLKYFEYKKATEVASGLDTTSLTFSAKALQYDRKRHIITPINNVANLNSTIFTEEFYKIDAPLLQFIADSENVSEECFLVTDQRTLANIGFFTPKIDSYIRDINGEPIKAPHADNSTITMPDKKDIEFKLLAPTIAELTKVHDHEYKGRLLIVDENDWVHGVLDPSANHQYRLYDAPFRRALYTEKPVLHNGTFSNLKQEIARKEVALMKTAFPIIGIRSEQQVIYSKFITKVLSPNFNDFINTLENQLYQADVKPLDIKEYLERQLRAFNHSIELSMSETFPDNTESVKNEVLRDSLNALRELTTAVTNYYSELLTKRNRCIAKGKELPYAKATIPAERGPLQLDTHKIPQLKNGQILNNSGNKPVEILERKTRDLLATIEQASIKVPNLPYNVIFSEDFTKDETMFKKQEVLSKDIRTHTLEMNTAEFKLMKKIFKALIDHEISGDMYRYEAIVDKTKEKYHQIKKFYAEFVADLNEFYNNPNSNEDYLNRVFDKRNRVLNRNGIDLYEELKPLIKATKDYYLKQFLIRENNKKICTKQRYAPYDLKRNYAQDGHRIGANSIEFTQLPSLQDKENVLLTLKNNVLASNRGIFTGIALAGLSVPAIAFLITILLDISLLSNPIGWVILGSAIAFTLVVTIATWISYKVSTTPKDLLSDSGKRFEVKHPDQMYQVKHPEQPELMTWKDLNSKDLAVKIAVSGTRWLSGFTVMWRILIILGFVGTKLKIWFATIGQRLVNFFIDKAQYDEKMLSRTIFTWAMPIIFGIGGAIVLSLGLLVIPSLGWLLVPVAITMIVIQIPVAVLNSYTKKKIEGEEQSYRAIILSALVPASLALLPLLGTIFSLAIMASSAVFLGLTLTAIILYNVYKIKVKENKYKEKVQKFTARAALGVAIGLTVAAIALVGVELFVTSAVAFGFFSLFPLFLPLVVILAAFALFITWRKVRKNYIRPEEDQDEFEKKHSLMA